uniref:Uncharacterized protein n=1 Tax=viral metagenome TaxID=1070528 RepID=A0A6H2A6E3_9ZZZZ
MLEIKKDDCEFCADYDWCDDYEETMGWGCTRPKGHEGAHVACGITYHEIHTWPQTVPVEETPV